MYLHFLNTEEYQFSQNEQAKIEKITENAYREAKNLLPMLSEQLNITVQPSDRVIPETGETATAVHKDLINLNINPDFEKGIDWVVDRHVYATVFHEAHHCARYKKYPEEESLLGNAVMEGLASIFERDYAEHPPLWSDYSQVPIQEWTEELLAHKDETDFDYGSWFFFSSDDRRWIGYRVGTYIVDQALTNHTNETPATLVHASPGYIVEMVGKTDRK